MRESSILGWMEAMNWGQEAVDADLGAVVEHFFNFGDFCSTFGVAGAGFWCGSRQNSVEKPVFCSTFGGARAGFGQRGCEMVVLFSIIAMALDLPGAVRSAVARWSCSA